MVLVALTGMHINDVHHKNSRGIAMRVHLSRYLPNIYFIIPRNLLAAEQ